ncbi:hypothetical protein B0H10DRAFT_1950732 [Mycena sp. CBHHK59/15]|nr:hypothetical protein B0H10DRAFT_1950732 [Mycena sp. CBHHK59/15]
MTAVSVAVLVATCVIIETEQNERDCQMDKGRRRSRGRNTRTEENIDELGLECLNASIAQGSSTGYNTVERNAPRSVGPGWLRHWRRGLKQDIEFMHHGDDVVHGLLQVESLLVRSRAEARKHTLISSMRCTVSLTAHKEEQDVLEADEGHLDGDNLFVFWSVNVLIWNGKCLDFGASGDRWLQGDLTVPFGRHPEAVTFKAKVNSKDKLSLFRVQDDSSCPKSVWLQCIVDYSFRYINKKYSTRKPAGEMPSGEDLPTPAVLVVEYFLLIYCQL